MSFTKVPVRSPFLDGQSPSWPWQKWFNAVYSALAAPFQGHLRTMQPPRAPGLRWALLTISLRAQWWCELLEKVIQIVKFESGSTAILTAETKLSELGLDSLDLLDLLLQVQTGCGCDISNEAISHRNHRGFGGGLRMTVQVETVDQWWADAPSLVYDHWQELGLDTDLKGEIDIDKIKS